MIRLILFISIIAVLSSCAILPNRNGNIRYVKSEKNIEIIDKTETTEDREERAEYKQLEGVERARSDEQAESIQFQDERDEPLDMVPEISKIPSDDTLKVSDESDELNSEIVYSAVRAEKHANASFFLFIAGLISILLPYFGIIPFIIGLFFFASSSNSRYITPFGEKRRKAAKAILFVDLVILLLWMGLVVLLLFVL